MRTRGTVQVHQIRGLAQLDKLGADQPAWAALMARMRRKTLVVCHPCHDAIHHRQPTTNAA
jgi:nitrate/TMAO reductase-like tetraheme cytochrome c subunit